MVILKLAKKSFETIGSNIMLLLFLVIVPLLQIYMIKTITDNTVVAASAEAYKGFVDTIFLAKVNNSNLMQAFTVGILVQFILMTGMIAGANIIREREMNTLSRIYTAPIGKFKLLSGILLGHSATMLMITMLIIISTSLVFGVSWGSLWIGTALVSLMAVYVAAAMAFLISAIFNNSKIAGGVMSVVVIGMTFLSGGIIQSDSLDVISNFTINKWISDAYLKIMLGNGFNDIIVNLLVLAAIGTVMVIAASMVYRRESIYG